MNSRGWAIDMIKNNATDEVMSELRLLLDSEREPGEPRDLLGAFEELAFGTDKFHKMYNNPVNRNIREIGLIIGMYREVSREELARIIATCSDFDTRSFVLEGKRYVYNEDYRRMS